MQQTMVREAPGARRLKCSEVWGGVRDLDMDAFSAGVNASLVSLACDGGKGGDIYYFSVCDADLLTRVVIADVVGHGPPVSAISEWLFDAMKMQLNNADGRDVLTGLNQLVVARGMDAMATASVAAFYRADSRLYFSYAGHPEMLILRKSERQWRTARQHAKGQTLAGLPLGVLSETIYPQTHLPLSSGDRFLLYTDGVIEAPSPRRELFGLGRLLQVLNANVGAELPQIKRTVLDALRTHTAGPLNHDDVTLLVFEIR